MRGDAAEPGSSLRTVPGSTHLALRPPHSSRGSNVRCAKGRKCGREDTFLSAEWGRGAPGPCGDVELPVAESEGHTHPGCWLLSAQPAQSA